MEETMKREGGNPLATTPISRLLLQFAIPSVLSNFQLCAQQRFKNYFGLLENIIIRAHFPVCQVGLIRLIG